MPINTLDAMLAGVQPPQYFCKSAVSTTRVQTTWGQPGIPGAGTYNTTLNGGTYSSSSALVPGQIPHYDPGSTLRAYVARLAMSNSVGTGGWYMLCDRLWDNGGITITSTTAQAIVSPTFPARTSGGALVPSGPLLALEVSAATGAGTPGITVSYTNGPGTSGRTATNVAVTGATSAAGTTYLLSLQSGDWSVQSVQSITLSTTWTSGTINLVAYIPLVAISSFGAAAAVDSITGGFARLYNGVVPYFMYQSTGSPVVVHGLYVESQG